MKRDSNYRSKRYLGYVSKPHIVLSRYDRGFIAFGACVCSNENWDMTLRFVGNLNAERAKS